MNPTKIIIDSSVAVKWYLPDEENTDAIKIKSDFTKKLVSVSVPILFFYEVSNILRTVSKSLRIDREKSTKAFEDILNLNFTTYFSKVLFKNALQKALNLDITAYDAAYVVLAEHLQISLFTADEKLVKKAKSKLVKSLSDY